MPRRSLRPLPNRSIATRGSVVALACGAVLLLVACGGDPAARDAAGGALPTAPATGADTEPIAQLPRGSLEAVALDVGVTLDADGRVVAPTERVRPTDAVHASLVTVGAASAAMLAVRWRDASGTVIDADERAITANGPAVHTFTRQPAGGWTPGRYEVDVRVNGESAGVRSFEVR